MSKQKPQAEHGKNCDCFRCKIRSINVSPSATPTRSAIRQKK